ncbi:MAG: hypothetical protein ACPGXK_02525 [Phycisphaerae bacterium]
MNVPSPTNPDVPKSEQTTGESWLIAAGVVLVASGLIHAIIGWLNADDWSGPESLRKPMLFGLATGVTALSLVPVANYIRSRSATIGHIRLAAQLFASAAVIEVGLITIQAWRGVPSHFNTSTAFDTTVHYAIDLLAIILTMVVAVWTGLSCRSKAPTPDVGLDRILSIRVGMVMLLLSCLFGIWMSFYGTARVKAGLPPGTFGEAGVLKFVHGMPMHALQFLLAGSWLMQWRNVPESRRYTVTWMVSLGLLLLTLFAVLQTFAGKSRFSFEPIALVPLLTGLLLLLSAWGWTALLLVGWIKPGNSGTSVAIHDAR